MWAAEQFLCLGVKQEGLDFTKIYAFFFFFLYLILCNAYRTVCSMMHTFCRATMTGNIKEKTERSIKIEVSCGLCANTCPLVEQGWKQLQRLMLIVMACKEIAGAGCCLLLH